MESPVSLYGVILLGKSPEQLMPSAVLWPSPAALSASTMAKGPSTCLATLHFTATSPAQNWWEQKLDGPVVTTQQLLQMPDHTVANVLAICGSITRQEKTQGMQVTIISAMWLNDDLL
jgi:hypothetical protein